MPGRADHLHAGLFANILTCSPTLAFLDRAHRHPQMPPPLRRRVIWPFFTLAFAAS